MTRNMKKLYTIINYCDNHDCEQCFMWKGNLCMFRRGVVPCAIRDIKFPNKVMHMEDIDALYAVRQLNRLCASGHCKQCEFYNEESSPPCLFAYLSFPHLWPEEIKGRYKDVHKAQETNL